MTGLISVGSVTWLVICFLILQESAIAQRGVMPLPAEKICRREPADVTTSKRHGDGGFRIAISGNPRLYMAGQVYTVIINGTFPGQTFNGFMLSVVPQHARVEDVSMGTLQIIDRNLTKSVTWCPHVTSHTNFRPKHAIQILWTAPQTGSGCVELRATVLERVNLWYKDDGALTMVLCEEIPPTLPPHHPLHLNDHPAKVPGECCACGSAKYEMTFEGKWSRESHPIDYPTNRRLLHWSNIVGASHSNNFRIWEYGGYATPGVKQVCEFGYPRKVEEEVKSHSKEARTIIKTTGIWWKDPMGIDQNRSARFTTDKRRHFVSMITMLGPSPDWCVGISAEDLCLPNCTWSDGVVYDLMPWDAGTDDGISFMSPNAKSDPQQRIRPITNTWPNDPKSPFYGTEPVKPVARLHITRLGPTIDPPQEGQQCPDDSTSDHDFFGEGESSALDNEKQKMMAAGGKCDMQPWDDWSSCSVTCGVGTRSRRRTYKDPTVTEQECGLPTLERENCIGIENECETIDEECSVTQWSQWSPCSVTCGRGVTERRRYYLIREEEYRCNRTMQTVKECSADQTDCRPVKRSHAICSLPSHAGPCRGNFQKWHYDSRTQKCLPFIYGGCRGNANRFETFDECQTACDDIDEPSNEYCLQPSEKGTCGKRLQMWYYDKDMQKCLSFEYSGCGGNKNRFITMDECTGACQSAVASSSNGGGARCNLVAEIGPCSSYQEKWHYDQQMGKCLPFQYGGCGGNGNNFNTMDECTDVCQLGISSGSSSSNNGGGARCNLPAEIGPCNFYQEKWHYDIQMGKCLPFQYGGCGGNTNNFNTMDECTEVCQLGISSGVTNSERRDSDVGRITRCHLPSEIGPCRSFQEKWHFDHQMGKCLPFQYGGCGGNANNFNTMDECSDACQSENGGIGSRNSDNTKCHLPFEIGPCRFFREKWYFDQQMGKCLPFQYGGCGGNANNFNTMDECSDVCQFGTGATNSRAKDNNKCFLPTDIGPCRFFQEKWYFDQQMEKCLLFQYGGCGGNDNNFNTMDECTETCQILSGEGDSSRRSSGAGSGRFKRFCTIEKDRGPCTGNIERWYFDLKMSKCLPFEYGGCAGNVNNFQTMDECMEACQDSYEEPNFNSETFGRNSNVRSIVYNLDSNRNNKINSRNTHKCHLPPDTGPCRAGIEKWYYDPQMGKCLSFPYGGCAGNENNFQTMEACTEACQINLYISNSNGSPAPSSNGQTGKCQHSPETGPCRANMERWYYDGQMAKCLPFQYGGCAGNENNFLNMEACVEACQTALESGQVHDNRGNSKSQCEHPPETGPCRANIERWYWDKQMSKCLPFQYGGCGGNSNSFENMYACLEACQPESSTGNLTPVVPSGDRCNLEPETGPCRAAIERWYYNSQMQKCFTFLYGGCGGNSNSFENAYSCLTACQTNVSNAGLASSLTSNVPTECLLPKVQGFCRASHPRWYYDNEPGECISFIYGGCGGNENNFGSFEECQEYCLGIRLDSFKPHPDLVAVTSAVSRPPEASLNGALLTIAAVTATSAAFISTDCQMGSWSSWSDCSATCGNGYRSRKREVVVPSSGEGRKCSKILFRKQKCKLPACENECVYGQWSQWDQCSQTCGMGSFRQRTQEPITLQSHPHHRPTDSRLPSPSSFSQKQFCPKRLQRTLCDVPECSF